MRFKSLLIGLLAIAACNGGRSGAFVVSGTVTTPTLQGGQAPVADVLVTLQSVLTIVDVTRAPIQITEEARTDAAGHFSIRAQPGHYSLDAEKSGYRFDGAYDVTVTGADIPGLDFVSEDITRNFISGTIRGAIADGVTVSVSGPASASATTSNGGQYRIGPLPAGQYTVTPAAPAFSFFPGSTTLTAQFSAPVNFLSTPPASQTTVTVAGDQASGVASTSTPSKFEPQGEINAAPAVALAGSGIDEWTFSLFFAGPKSSTTAGDFGGTFFFSGQPAAGTFTRAVSQGFNLCWLSGTSVEWTPADFTLTITSVGDPVPFLGESGIGPASWYPIHGTLHADCSGRSSGTFTVVASGTVTVDASF